LVAVVVAKDDVDRPGESLGDLGQRERRAEIAAENQDFCLQASQQRFQLPDVVVNVG
jgi:hypothetical protein